jgi:hypothetical protein
VKEYKVETMLGPKTFVGKALGTDEDGNLIIFSDEDMEETSVIFASGCWYSVICTPITKQ